MGWEQDISEKLQQLQSVPVRFDIVQEPTAAEQARARANISIGATATDEGQNNYKITFQ